MGMCGNLIRVSQLELDQYIEDSSKLLKLIYESPISESENYFKLDKNWDGIQFILTEPHQQGNIPNEVLSKALVSYQFVDEQQDLGYGPAFFLRNIQVKETAKELELIDLKIVEANKQNIFPYTLEEPERVEYAMRLIQSMVQFFKKAASNNEATIFYIN